MNDSDLFNTAKPLIESCHGVQQALAALPANIEIEVILDGRIICSLTQAEDKPLLQMSEAPKADLSYTIFPECIRRLTDNSPNDIWSLAEEITRQIVGGQIRFKVKTSWKDIYKKGYFSAISQLGPELQSYFAKYSFALISQASSTFESIKKILRT